MKLVGEGSSSLYVKNFRFLAFLLLLTQQVVEFWGGYFAYNLDCDLAFGFNAALCLSLGAGTLSGGKWSCMKCKVL